MSQKKIISTGYIPRPGQAELHQQLKRFNLIICHRRWGKTIFAVNEKIDRGLRLYKSRKLPRPRYSYIAPTYGQAKKIAWDIFKAYCVSIPGVKFNEQELRIDISLFGDETDTLRFQLLGAENPDSLRGIYNDGVTLDEPAQMPPNLWAEVIRPTLLDRNGWANFIGTPKSKNALFDFYEKAKNDPEWFTKTIRASESGVIPQSELDALLREMGEEMYAQELECSWSATNKGSYYGKQMSDLEAQGRITGVPYDPAVGVITAWDLGISDSTAIWFAQRVGREIHLIDHMEVAGLGIPDIVKKLKEKDYLYTTHLLPHDAGARELGTGKTRQEVLLNLGIRGDILPRQKVDDGIQAVRNMLGQCWFDKNKCALGIMALREYSRGWNEKLQMFENKPKHDEWSHSADAMRALALGIDRERGLVQNKRQETAIIDYADLGSY